MRITRRPDAVLALAGRFDANEAPEFVAFVAEQYGDAQQLKIDLSEVTFIDSTALAELVRLHKADSPMLTLCSPSFVVNVILELTGLDQVFTVDGLTSDSDSSLSILRTDEEV